MEQFIEFASRHYLLVGGFVAVLALLVWSEVTRRVRGVRELTASQAVALINDGSTIVADVQSSADYSKGHIVGSRNLAPSRFQQPDKEIEKLKGQKVLVVCKNGQASPAVAATLKRFGAAEVSVLKGGLAQWISEQYPVTRK